MSAPKSKPGNPRAIVRGPSGEKLVAVGRFGRPHGIGGEIRLDAMGGLPRGLSGYTVFYMSAGGGVMPVDVKGWRTGDKLLFVTVRDVADRDAAAKFTGKTLYVPRSQLPPLKEGEYYYADVEGAKVVDYATGEELGEVADIKQWGDYDMLFVLSGKKTWLLPVTGEFVKEMDPEGGIIRVSVPEGLGP